MTAVARQFAQGDAEARDKFLAVADARGLAVENHVHPLELIVAQGTDAAYGAVRGPSQTH